MPASGGGWTEEILYSFGNGPEDAAGPGSSLIFDAEGNLYGTTTGGGNGKLGTAFELSPTSGSWVEKVIFNFHSDDRGVGGYPFSGLIFDGSGNLYGATGTGLSGLYGAVFELTPNGSGGWMEKVLHAFNGTGATSLMFGTGGNLYGTLWRGGPLGAGEIFELTPATGGGWVERLLHRFTDNRDGGYPNPGLVLDAAGNLYGSTAAGGSQGGGTVFEIKP